MPQARRSYSKTFKAKVIAEFEQADTSFANVALTDMRVTSSVRAMATRCVTAIWPVESRAKGRCVDQLSLSLGRPEQRVMPACSEGPQPRPERSSLSRSM